MRVVYVLFRLSDRRVRYVGQTKETLTSRLYHHKYAAARGGGLPVHYWLRKHDDVVIAEFLSGAVEDADEIAAIALAKAEGCRLLNVTDGGGGIKGFHHSQATKESQSRALRGRVITPEWRAKISKRLTGRKLSDETRANMRLRYARAREQRSAC